ncbi:MAG: molybdopterin-binding protein [bacterium]|nr:molybdopterin-binding protein [bacterium]
MKTASALIIGDEILTGKIRDENSVVLAQVLFECGVKLARIEIIPDDISEISRSIKIMSNTFDHVFTSGGIGPTHDDKTYEAIAHAFDLKLEYHEPTLAKFIKYHELYGNDKLFATAHKKMALFPMPCEVTPVEKLWISLVTVKNVHILPGIPHLFHQLLQVVRPKLQGKPFERVLIYTKKYEGEIADILSDTQEEFPSVAIGSYPQKSSEHKVMVSVEGQDNKIVNLVAQKIALLIDGFNKEEKSPLP